MVYIVERVTQLQDSLIKENFSLGRFCLLWSKVTKMEKQKGDWVRTEFERWSGRLWEYVASLTRKLKEAHNRKDIKERHILSKVNISQP